MKLDPEYPLGSGHFFPLYAMKVGILRMPYLPHKFRGTPRMVASACLAISGNFGFSDLHGPQPSDPKYSIHRLPWPPPPLGAGEGEGALLLESGGGLGPPPPPPPPPPPSGHWPEDLTTGPTLLPNCPPMFPPTPYMHTRRLPYTPHPSSVVAFQTTWV